MTTFLLRAPPALFSSCTQAQALKVLAFLKRDLGVKQEYLFPRIVCAAPGVLLQVGFPIKRDLGWWLGLEQFVRPGCPAGVTLQYGAAFQAYACEGWVKQQKLTGNTSCCCCFLLQDIETQLQPLLDYLTSLGLDVQHAARMACVYPELLLSSVQEQLQPLVGYLQGLGCSAAQAARLLQVRAWPWVWFVVLMVPVGRAYFAGCCRCSARLCAVQCLKAGTSTSGVSML